MRIELPCEIVQDLLPSYIDELTSPTTGEAVEAHLETCENCMKMYRDMKGGSYEYNGESSDSERSRYMANDSAEVDYLKKTRSRARRGILGGILLTAVLILGVVFTRFYLMSTATSSYMIDYTIAASDDCRSFEIFGNLLDYNRGVAKVEWEENGDTLNIVIKSSLRSPFHSNSFDEGYMAQSEIRQITINGTVVVWYEGEQIMPEVAQIYKDRTLYVGSFEAIGKLAQDVGLSNYLNTHCTNELQTTTEPYGWMLHGQDTITEEDYREYEIMLPQYGAVLIATIDNLGYMEFDFDVEGERKTIRVTEQDADHMLGSSVKACAGSPIDLQNMIVKLGIRPNIYGSTQSMGPYVKDNFDFRIDNDCSEDIYAVSVDLRLNGDTISGSTTMNADYSALEKGRVGVFSFTPEDGSNTIDMTKDKVSVYITIYGEGRDLTNDLGTLIVELDPDDSDYYDGKVYSRTFSISGSSADGFSVN